MPKGMDQRSVAMADSLSARERQLVVLASKGMTDIAIAHNLGISLATVGTYWGRVRIKFGPLSRTELVAVFLKEHATSIVESLRAENQMLVEALEQKNREEERLRSDLDLFRGMLDSAINAILLVNEQGAVTLANDNAEQLFGYDPGEMVGLSVELLVPERYRENHVLHRFSYNENPIKRQMGEHLATYALRKDGTEFPMAVALRATDTANGLAVTCIIQDLSHSLSLFAK